MKTPTVKCLFLVLAIFYAGALPLILTNYNQGRAAVDTQVFHYPTIQHFTHTLDVHSYPCSMAPGYHILLARVARCCPDSMRTLKLAGSVFTALLFGLLVWMLTPRFGVLHTTAGYLVYVMQTFKWIFDIREQDIFWCTADIGWDAGHGYTVYGPLVNGVTSLLYEGGPNHPYPDRFWEIVEKYGVTIFYTAAKTLHALMKSGNHQPERHDLSTLRLLGATGSPMNPKLWMWYRNTIGHGKCPIVETWWQAETGGIVISPFPGATPCKPGSAALPFFGIKPEIIRDNPDQTALDEDGWLVINRPWPGLMRRFYGAPDRFKSIHFSKFPGTYATGDRAITDADGYFWMMDRNDEDIATPRHSPDTAEAEITPISQPFFAEAAGAACLKIVDQPTQERLPFTVDRINGEQRTENVTFMTLKMDAMRRDDLISAHRNQRRAQAAYRETPPRNPTVTSRA